MRTITKEEYIKTLKELENSSPDKIGTIGTVSNVAIGTATGVLGAPAIASTLGGATFMGSTSLASIVGGVLTVSTPVGWIVGIGAVGALSTYTIAKLISSGAKNDERKSHTIAELKKKIDAYNEEIKTVNSSEKINKLAGAYALLLENNLIDKETVISIIKGVEDNTIDAEYALYLAKKKL